MNTTQPIGQARRSFVIWAVLGAALCAGGLAWRALPRMEAAKPSPPPPGDVAAALFQPSAAAPLASAQPLETDQPVQAMQPERAQPAGPGLRAPRTMPNRQVHFEPNRGQAAVGVRYVARANGVVAHVRDDGITLTPTAERRAAGALRAGESSAASTPAMTTATATTATTVTTAIAPSRRGHQAESPVHLSFVGANRDGSFDAREAADASMHYLVGAQSSAWLHNVPLYRQLRYAGLYPGIDLVYYSRDGELEYDLVVQPGADPAAVRFRVAGKHAARLARNGDLLLDGANGALRLKQPVLYQNIDGERKTLDGSYVLLGRNLVGFKLPAYDRTRRLIIDPTFKLLYSTYLPGLHDDQVGAIALDRDGNAYVVGSTASEDFLVTGNAYQTEPKRPGFVNNVVVSKFSVSGTLLYSTFLGGTVGDFGLGIAVDAAGQAHVTGHTQSADFPTTAGAFQRTRQGSSNAFVATLSPDGSSLVYSTFFGGSGGSNAMAIAIDAAGHTVIAGSAGPGLPTTAGAFKTALASGSAAFVARFDERANGAAQLVAATYYGADVPQANSQTTGNLAFALALGANGTPWITGQAYTGNLPTTTGAPIAAPTAMDAACSVSSTLLNSFAYIAQLSHDLRSLAYASYLSGKTRAGGACSEYGHAIAIDVAGNVFVGGATASNAFPTSAGAAQPAYPGAGGINGYVSFVTRLARDGSAIQWSSYVGGNAGNTFLSTVAFDAAANAIWGASVTAGGTNFPLSTDALQSVHGGNFDAALTQLDAATGALRYSTFIGGSGLDNALAVAADTYGNAFVAGVTKSINFPVTSTAIQSTLTLPLFDRGDWFFSILGGGTIGPLRPSHGGNTGDVTVSTNAAGVLAQARARLVDSAGNAIASIGTASQAGDSSSFTFALKGTPAGLYDLVIENPDGTMIEKKGAFTILAGGTAPQLSVDVSGRSKIRVGVPAQYQLTVSNSGNTDAYFAVANLAMPAHVQARFEFAPLPPAFPGDTTDYSQITGTTVKNGVAHTAIVFPIVPAGRSATVAFEVTVPNEASNLPIEATLFPCAVSSQEELRQLFDAGVGASMLARKRPLVTLPISPDGRCALTIFSVVAGGMIGFAAGTGIGAPVLAAAVGGVLLGTIVNVAIAPGGYSLPALTLDGMKTLVSSALPAWAANLWSGLDILDVCDPDGSRRQAAVSAVIQVLNAMDPNDKTGPAGDGSEAHHIASGRPLVYSIGFENMRTASLPAAQVVVTDQLDPNKVDLGSLTLGAITIGATTLPVPPGLNSFATTHPIDATVSVRIQGSLNPTTGVLKWTFDTLDPQTGLPPSDPTLGFLPPNADGIQGQGYVRFTLMPKTGQANGTEFSNSASIVFDANAAIVTPVWLNTLDLSAPASKVQSLVGQPGTSSFTVTWAGTDSGSGAARYTVFVADNGGTFTPWQNAVTSTSVSYAGVIGHTYDFHVVATDAVGNREAPKSVAEASISVSGNFPDPTVGGGGASGSGGGGCTVASGNSRSDISLPLLVLAAGIAMRRRGAGSRRAQQAHRV